MDRYSCEHFNFAVTKMAEQLLYADVDEYPFVVKFLREEP
jgi:hypothetical protein